MYPECLKNLIECLKDFPGVGDKSAERMADRGDDVDAILDRVKNDNSAFKGFNAYDLYFNSGKFTVDEIVAMIAALR